MSIKIIQQASTWSIVVSHEIFVWLVRIQEWENFVTSHRHWPAPGHCSAPSRPLGSPQSWWRCTANSTSMSCNKFQSLSSFADLNSSLLHLSLSGSCSRSDWMLLYHARCSGIQLPFPHLILALKWSSLGSPKHAEKTSTVCLLTDLNTSLDVLPDDYHFTNSVKLKLASRKSCVCKSHFSHYLVFNVL